MARGDKRREYVQEQAEVAVLGGYDDEKQVLRSIEELAWHELRGNGELLELTTADRPLGTWTARALRDGILCHLPAS
jgi:hypothetical protein